MGTEGQVYFTVESMRFATARLPGLESWLFCISVHIGFRSTISNGDGDAGAPPSRGSYGGGVGMARRALGTQKCFATWVIIIFKPRSWLKCPQHGTSLPPAQAHKEERGCEDGLRAV